MNSYLFTESGTIQAIIDYTPYTVNRSHPKYGALKDAAKARDWKLFVELYDGKVSSPQADVSKVQIEGIEFKDDRVYYKGHEVSNSVVDVIRRYVREGIDTASLLKFLERLLQNPSFNSIKQFYQFIDANGLTIDEEGYVLFYKVVRADYRDKHSGRFDNSPGQIIECPRSEVDDNPTHTCSNGFHVGGFAYSGPGGSYYQPGDRVIICRVDPADVVSVPVDANAGKCRCCKYEVLADFTNKLPKGLSTYEGLPEEDHIDDYNGPQNSVDDELFDDDDEEDDLDDDEDIDDEDYDNYPLLVQGLSPGDVITFNYRGETRRVEVNTNDGANHLMNGRLLKGDPSYPGGISNILNPKFRNFYWGEMEDIVVG